MSEPNEIAEALLEKVLAAPLAGRRRLIAIAGPPASEKSILSDILANRMTAAGSNSLVIPLDGFHIDNQILTAKGLLDRKGAPETFDVEGLLRLVKALPSSETVYFPIFDRKRDIAIFGAGVVLGECDCKIVEGNYLLYDAPGWRDLKGYWDFTVQLDVPIPILRKRLVDRWLAHGLTPDQATSCAEGNDLRNAGLVASQLLASDVTMSA